MELTDVVKDIGRNKASIWDIIHPGALKDLMVSKTGFNSELQDS